MTEWEPQSKYSTTTTMIASEINNVQQQQQLNRVLALRCHGEPKTFTSLCHSYGKLSRALCPDNASECLGQVISCCIDITLHLSLLS